MNPIRETNFAVAHAACLARSFQKWTGHELLPGDFAPPELAVRHSPWSRMARRRILF
jgi:hypothetical protein